ncbi:response regulator [Chitinophaga silvatica]|uniref:histidine kinase n=1 Tax=Chitinophaga silvatica TaxID=2282649 RepID=A0A3E1YG42_9BACT|nr:ATP-binding protein [Chitinophaga silvatica]RFS26349.1 response regulator [Chitinophaga silvatica]
MDSSNALPRIIEPIEILNDQQKRHTQIVDALAVIGAILAFSLGCMFYSLTGNEQIFYPAMLEALLFLSVLACTRYTSVQTGKKLLFILHTFFIGYFGIILGRSSQIYLFAPFLAFSTLLVYQKWFNRIFVMTFCGLMIILVQLNYKSQLIKALPLSASFQYYLHWIAIATATFLNGSVLYYYAKESKFQYQRMKSLVEQLNKTNQSMRIYVRETTHEIRSPLNVVNSILQNYLEAADENKRTIQVGKAHLDAVHFACQDIQLVMNNTLSWSKIEAGKVEISKSTFQIREWLNQLCETYDFLGKKRAVHVSVSISDQLPEYILTDISKLRSIIVNLLSNAIKFTALHSIVRVTASVQNGELRFTVTDQGKGIPDPEKEHIFDPYVSATQHQNESTGLGLPIARHLARQLGGDLHVTDNPNGKGSTFILLLPLELAVPPNITTTKEDIDYELLKGIKILVTDDDSMNQLAFTLALERLGINVILADSGNDCITKARLFKPDIIIMDMVMPKISGVEVLSLLQKDKELKHIPTILVSGNCFSEVQEEVISSGADGFLSKPVDFEELYHTLKNLVVYA